jgi:hypothetical protein
MSGKKHSHQHNFPPSSIMANADGVELHSDRQTLKMNDFLKQVEAYSNETFDKIAP